MAQVLKTSRLLPHRPAIIATILLRVAVAAILLAMDRPTICACGPVKLWQAMG